MTMESTDEKKDNVCRLCLNCEGATFSPLDESAKESLSVVVPELTLSTADNFVICEKCKDTLEKCSKLKKLSSETDQFVRTQIDKLKITDKVNLNRLVNKSEEANTDANSESANNGNICRICLKNDEGNFMSINTATTENLLSTALKTCLPEMDADITTEPGICEVCHTTLCDMHSFKKGCKSVEDKLKRYSDATSESDLDLAKVLIFLKAESKKGPGEDNFLSEFEVQDEEEADIFDIFPNFSGEAFQSSYENNDNNKRPLTDATPGGPGKKPKIVAEDELPHFSFNFNLIFNPQLDGTMENWLEKVGQLKEKFGWTDYVTIHKVLVKLEGMEDLYTWFSKISEIMTWDEWKKKLVQMFPTSSDFFITLKRLLNRKKRTFETYTEYYDAKLKLLQDMNITGEKAVSCLIGGITDISVGCIARVGNYKTPEELLEYFKTCNDKKPSAAAPAKNIKPKDKGNNKVTEDKNSPSAKKKIKCFNCRKFGHTSKECWAMLEDFPNGAKATAKPPTTSSTPKTAQRPRLRPRQRRKCVSCGSTSHVGQPCPIKRSPVPPTSKPQSQKVQASRQGSSKNANRFRAGVEKKPPRAPQNVNKDRSTTNRAPKSRCRNCGMFGHLHGNCRRPRQEPPVESYSNRNGGRFQQQNNDRYFNRDMVLGRMQDSSNMVCFKCFRVGHDARDCMEYAGRAFLRN